MVGLITHDWIEKDGGAEKVLQSFSNLFPNADLFTLWNESEHGSYQTRILESKLSRLNFNNRKIVSLPIMPFVWSQFNTSQYDWILSSTHLFAHHVNPSSAKKVIKKCVYVHTPARYLWEPNIDSRGDVLLVRMVAKPLKKIDQYQARNSDSIASNSHFVKTRVEKFWKRDSIVIYPPVEVHNIQSTTNWEEQLQEQENEIFQKLNFDFLFAASRLVKYKQIEKAIHFAKWNDIPLVIAGSGPEFERLQTLSIDLKIRTIFLGRVSNSLMRALYRKSFAYVFPPIEDFGIMPVEAMASGAVVIANQIGGTSETIVDGESGLLVNFEDESLCKQAFSRITPTLRVGAIERSKIFSRERFELEIVDWLRANGISQGVN